MNSGDGTVTSDNFAVKESVTEDVEADSGGMNGGIIAVVIVVVILVLLGALWATLNIIAKKCPTSGLGKKINDWKAQRALSQEQKKLRALEKLKGATPFSNHTNASEEVSSNGQSDNVILQSGMKLTLSENGRVNNANRIYPATDVDDGVHSQQPNVHPSGLVSADEFSVEGDGKHGFKKSKIAIIKEPKNYDIAAMKTID